MKKPSYKTQINLMCKQCSYDPDDKGTWREQVRDCNVSQCPLYHLRPLPRGHKHLWQKVMTEEEKKLMQEKLNG